MGDASLVIVRTLSGSSEVKALLARIPKDYDEHRKRPVIVFDFRGNGGGSDQPVYDWIAKAKPGPWADPYVQIAVTGAARACGEWNDLVLNQIFFDRVDTPEARAERDAFLAATPLGDVRGAPAQVLSGPPEPSHAASPYQGRIFAIIDDASSSSGETAPDALRAALGATVLGERSAGYLEFGNIYPYVMPRTGVVWKLASQRNYYAEPRDGVGLPVDVYLDADLIEAPVEELLPLLEKLPRR